MKSLLIKSAAALGLVLAAATATTPALADWDHHDGWRAREWREHQWRAREAWRAHEWREHYRHYGYRR